MGSGTDDRENRIGEREGMASGGSARTMKWQAQTLRAVLRRLKDEQMLSAGMRRLEWHDRDDKT